MRCEFSEFTYGFAITFEIVDSIRGLLQGPPQLPNLNEEGMAGYDVRMDGLLGWTYLAQYKVPEHMVRATAAEWPDWGQAYLRFSTRHESDQHDLLVQLEQASVFNVVQYVCPCFHSAGDLTTAFQSRTIEDRSLKLRPSRIGLGNHVVTFDDQGNYLIRSDPVSGFADPRERRVIDLGGEREVQQGRSRTIDAELFESTLQHTLSVVREVRGPWAGDLAAEMLQGRRDRDQVRPSATERAFADLALLVRFTFGAQLFVVPERPTPAHRG